MIYPGSYTGCTVHIHLEVHLDKKTVPTMQLYFDDPLSDEIFSTVSRYTDHAGRDTRNDTDNIYNQARLLATSRKSDRSLAAIRPRHRLWPPLLRSTPDRPDRVGFPSPTDGNPTRSARPRKRVPPPDTRLGSAESDHRLRLHRRGVRMGG